MNRFFIYYSGAMLVNSKCFLALLGDKNDTAHFNYSIRQEICLIMNSEIWAFVMRAEVNRSNFKLLDERREDTG